MPDSSYLLAANCLQPELLWATLSLQTRNYVRYTNIPWFWSITLAPWLGTTRLVLVSGVKRHSWFQHIFTLNHVDEFENQFLGKFRKVLLGLFGSGSCLAKFGLVFLDGWIAYGTNNIDNKLYETQIGPSLTLTGHLSNWVEALWSHFIFNHSYSISVDLRLWFVSRRIIYVNNIYILNYYIYIFTVVKINSESTVTWTWPSWHVRHGIYRIMLCNYALSTSKPSS